MTTTGLKYKLYHTTEDVHVIVRSIKEELYLRLPKEGKPTRDEFFISFDRKCGTNLIMQILDRISDDLNKKI
jgi:hypothetical protein